MSVGEYMKPQERLQHFIDESLSESNVCSYPGCGKRAIRSHVLQQEGPLRQIALDGKVLCVDNYRGLLRYARRMFDANSIIPPDLSIIGIDQATTYPGFCEDHDIKVFESIEHGNQLVVGDMKQLVAFYRRVFFHMMHVRKQWLLVGEKLARDHDTEDLKEMRSVLIPDFIALSTVFVQRTWSEGFESHLKYVWRVINRNVEVACAGSILAATADCSAGAFVASALPFATFSLIPEGNKTHALLIWDSGFDSDVQGMRRQMMSNNASDLCRAINELTFVKCSDYCVNPILWANCSEQERSIVLNNLRYDVMRSGGSKIPNIIKFSNDDLVVA